LINGFRQWRPRADLLNVSLHASEHFGKAGSRAVTAPLCDLSWQLLFRTLLIVARGLGQRFVVRTPPGMVLRPIEQRITDAEIRSAGVTGFGVLAERLQGSHRRQHGNGLPGAEPGDIAIVGGAGRNPRPGSVTSTPNGRLVRGPAGTISKCLSLISSS